MNKIALKSHSLFALGFLLPINEKVILSRNHLQKFPKNMQSKWLEILVYFTWKPKAKESFLRILMIKSQRFLLMFERFKWNFFLGILGENSNFKSVAFAVKICFNICYFSGFKVAYFSWLASCAFFRLFKIARLLASFWGSKGSSSRLELAERSTNFFEAIVWLSRRLCSSFTFNSLCF